ncbi:hypothetical protein Tco_0479011 [Tanacetum coccineum]
MSNTNMQTQTSNALHNAILEAGDKDRLPMLVPVPVAEGSSKITTERYMENYKNVSQDIRDQLNAEAKAIQIILIGIDKDIYSIVDACPNACEMWKAIERLKQGESINVQDLETNLLPQATRNRGKAIVNSSAPTYDQKPTMVTEDDEIRANQDNSPRNNRGTGYENQRAINVAWARENVAYHKEKMLLCKQEEAEFQLNVEQADWKDDTDDESDNQELEAHYIEQDDQDDTDELNQERDLLASLIEKLKSEIDDGKNRNKFLETSNKALVDKLKVDVQRFQAEHDKYHDVNYASKVEIDCAKAKGDLLSYKIKSEKSSNEYTQKINDLNQTISDRKKELFTHQETISIMSREKEAQIKFYKTREDKELDKVIALENKVKLNNLYDLFVPQREKSPEQHYFSTTLKMNHTSANKEISKESFRKQTTLLEKRMDESIPWDQKCKSSKELFKIKKSVDTIFDGVERCKQTIAKRTYFGNIDSFIQNTIEGNFCPKIRRINADLEKFHLCLNEEMVADLRYFNSLEHKVDTLKSQLKTQKTQFLNEIDRLLRGYYYADHMNAIHGVYTDLDKVTNLQCDYLETLEKCEHLEKELSKSRTMSKSFEALQKHAINLELDLQ